MGDTQESGETPQGLGTSGRRALGLGFLGYALFVVSLSMHEGTGLFGHPGDFAPGALGVATVLTCAGAILLTCEGYSADGRGARLLRLATAAFCLPPAACVIGAAGFYPALAVVPLGVVAAPILSVAAAIRGARPRWAIVLTALPAFLGLLVAIAWVLFIYALRAAGGP